MGKVYMKVYHVNANCHFCGNVETYDTLKEACNRLSVDHDDTGFVLEVSTVRVLRMVEGEPVPVVMDAGGFFATEQP